MSKTKKMNSIRLAAKRKLELGSAALRSRPRQSNQNDPLRNLQKKKRSRPMNRRSYRRRTRPSVIFCGRFRQKTAPTTEKKQKNTHTHTPRQHQQLATFIHGRIFLYWGGGQGGKWDTRHQLLCHRPHSARPMAMTNRLNRRGGAR